MIEDCLEVFDIPRFWELQRVDGFKLCKWADGWNVRSRDIDGESKVLSSRKKIK
jgi:hypothetical protein